MSDPPRKHRAGARQLLFDAQSSAESRRAAEERLQELADKAAALLNDPSVDAEDWVRVKPAHIRILVALSQLTPPGQLSRETHDDDAPTQESIAALAGYQASWVSEGLLDLRLRFQQRGFKHALVRDLTTLEKRRTRSRLHRKQMYWLTQAGHQLVDALFP